MIADWLYEVQLCSSYYVGSDSYREGQAAVKKTIVLTTLAMIAFAGNSLLCRMALKDSGIDAATFTTVRLVAGALTLWLVVLFHRQATHGKGNWLSALALFIYASGFSFAYVKLPAATGALLLFGAVQATMIGFGMWSGERLRGWQWLGLIVALAGVVGLMVPGLAAPPLLNAMLMLAAGIAWGIYSLRGKGAGDPTRVTAGNFLRAVPMAIAMSVFIRHNMSVATTGVVYAIASGAITSGLGYAIWYAALPALKAMHAATVQLSVPVIAALGGILFLHEPPTWRLLLASIAILGGIALVIVDKRVVTTAVE